ncbi:MAG: trypsin-like peptidase domain-containing protein [Bacteroidia bacterium]|nr:trypsin-like peptidase domain-containing protein [Bacteroidia bacterium]MBT8277324.1 trypsin-like peptidase domain-containing protein [Bacteroidia bacterium]NNF30253.1 PDZ domain-containing protein [Flavobacteriaceae bacterium]NNK54260.1 PDZ domain-containing protein [Flavobacteriaceae bacterium]NNM09013.1 PDZ domain-containing protein [Flavobacteriaceae bacterium]
MKQTVRLFAVALIAGAITLWGYKLLEDDNPVIITANQENPTFIPTNYTSELNDTGIDLTKAAEKTVNAVVHVKNTTISRRPTNIMEYFYGGGEPRAMVGAGSGVIITPDGYIVTNNHVIANASQLEVTLNNNKIYEAELIGTDAKTDIALIKIEPDEDLPFVPFGDSNEIRIGEWVLAVGNPFNLTSTVTAGIVSAKARDLNEFDRNPQSFIQTDAAVNRGNSGGALVNIRGELVGINTAITSETGSYVGYSFAVPANIARKVIEDIIEYGDVQRGILGIQGQTLNSKIAQKLGLNESEGVIVGGIEDGSGADKSGIREGDIIKGLDGYKVGKFSDLSGYLGSKRPNDVVDVTVIRNGKKKVIPVTLIKLETYEIEELGLELKNASQEDLKKYGVDGGVMISRALTKDMQRYDLDGILITKINDQPVRSIDDAKRIMNRRNTNEDIKLTFYDRDGDLNTFIFR